MDKRKSSILKTQGKIPFQEIGLPDFSDDDTTTATVTKSRRVSFGANLVKEFIVGSAVTTQFYTEYEQAVSSSDSSNQNTSRSGILDLSSFNVNDALNLCVKPNLDDEYDPLKKKFCSEKSYAEAHERNTGKNWDFNVGNDSNIFTDKSVNHIGKSDALRGSSKSNLKAFQQTDLFLGPEKNFHASQNDSEFYTSKFNDTLDKKMKHGKFSSTICFSADSPSADMEFTEGCISLAKSILDKKKKDMTVYIESKPKENKREKECNSTILFESTGVEMSLTKCMDNSLEDDSNVSKLFHATSLMDETDYDKSRENIENIPPQLDNSEDYTDIKRNVFYPDRSLTQMLGSDTTKSISDEDNNEECDMELDMCCDHLKLSVCNETVNCANGDDKENCPLTTNSQFMEKTLPIDCSLFRKAEKDSDMEILTCDPLKTTLTDNFLNSDSDLDLSNYGPLKLSLSVGSTLDSDEANDHNGSNPKSAQEFICCESPSQKDVEEQEMVMLPSNISTTSELFNLQNENSYDMELTQTDSLKMSFSGEDLIEDEMEITNVDKTLVRSIISESGTQSEGDEHVTNQEERIGTSTETESEKGTLGECQNNNEPVNSTFMVKPAADVDQYRGLGDEIGNKTIEHVQCEMTFTKDLSPKENSTMQNDANTFIVEKSVDKALEDQEKNCNESNVEERQNLNCEMFTKEVTIPEAGAETFVLENKTEEESEKNFIETNPQEVEVKEQVQMENEATFSREGCVPREEPNKSFTDDLRMNQSQEKNSVELIGEEVRIEKTFTVDQEQDNDKCNAIITENIDDVILANEGEAEKVNELNLSSKIQMESFISVNCTEPEKEAAFSSQTDSLNVFEGIEDLANEVDETDEMDETDVKKSFSMEYSSQTQEIEVQEMEGEYKEYELQDCETPGEVLSGEAKETEGDHEGLECSIPSEDMAVEEPVGCETSLTAEEMSAPNALNLSHTLGCLEENTNESPSRVSQTSFSNEEDVEMKEVPIEKSSSMDESTICMGDKKIFLLLKEQSQEPNCRWTMDDNPKNDFWCFSFPILESSVVVKFKLKPPKEDSTVFFSQITKRTIELRKQETFFWENDQTALDFGFEKYRNHFERNSRDVDTVHKIPLFLDMMNLFLTKINGVLNQVVRILREYPGSRFSNSKLSFRLYSFPFMFSYMVMIDMKDPLGLSEGSITIEKHFGNFSTTKIKSVFKSCLDNDEVIIAYIRTLNQLVINMERETGAVTNRSHIRLIA